MATRAQRLSVGIFMLAGGALTLAGLLIMTGYSQTPKTPYWMEFDYSVLGLNVGAVVEYLGVPVGAVTDIRVTGNNMARVEIDVDTTKVILREGVNAKPVMFSFATGVLYISLSGGEPNARELPAYSQIPTIPSLTTSLMNEIQSIQGDLGRIVKEVADGLDGLEEGQLSRIINSAESAVGRLDTALADADDMILAATDAIGGLRGDVQAVVTAVGDVAASLRTTSDKIAELTDDVRTKLEPLDTQNANAQLQEILERTNALAATVNDAAATLRTTTESVAHETDNVEYSVRVTFQALQEAVTSVQDLAESLKQDPSALLRGRGTPKESP